MGKCDGDDRWTKVEPAWQGEILFAHQGWTGREFIVWSPWTMVGYRFDTHRDTWRKMSSAPRSAFVEPKGFGAVSSGRFFAWNHAGGAAYDWVADAWTPIAPMNGTPFSGMPIIGAGAGSPTHLIHLNCMAGPTLIGAIYSVAQDAWLPLPEQGAPTCGGLPVAVWAENEFLVRTGSAINDGARFNPATMSWRPMSNVNAPLGGHAAVWTGNRLFVWSAGDVPSGGFYDPALDAWTTISVNGAPAGGAFHAVWTGKEVIVMGTFSSDADGIYYPATDTWRAMATRPIKAVNVQWDGCRVLVCGGYFLATYEPPRDP